MEEIIAQLEKSLLAVNHVASREILKPIMNEMAPLDLIENLLVPVMNSIGDGWEKGTVLYPKFI